MQGNFIVNGDAVSVQGTDTGWQSVGNNRKSLQKTVAFPTPHATQPNVMIGIVKESYEGAGPMVLEVQVLATATQATFTFITFERGAAMLKEAAVNYLSIG